MSVAQLEAREVAFEQAGGGGLWAEAWVRLRRNPGAIDPYKNQALKPEEYEAMGKLYEVRIHILRINYQGSVNGGQGAVSRRYIATFTKRISVK